MLFHQESSLTKLLPLDVVDLGQLYGLEPEFRGSVAVLSVDVRRLGSLVAVEKNRNPSATRIVGTRHERYQRGLT
jgi:hypothetical protein